MVSKVVVSLVFLVAGLAHAEWRAVESQQPAKSRVEVVESNSGYVKLHFKLSGLDLTTAQINGQKFTVVQSPGMNALDLRGLPALPQLAKSIAIPQGSQVSIKLESVKTETWTIKDVVPSKGSFDRTVNPSTVPYSFDSMYQRGGVFPAEHFAISNTFKMRDINGVSLLIRPAAYNSKSKQLEVVTDAVVVIRTQTVGRARFFQNEAPVDMSFDSLYTENFLNYGQLKNQRDIVSHWAVDSGKLLVITAPQFAKAMQPYVDWKTQRGLVVNMVTTDQTGTTPDAIQDFITKQYNNDHISYVLLVGDAEHVPPHEGKSGNAYGAEADPLYGVVDGNDIYPDIFVSRFSVKTNADVENIVSRTVNYELNPDSSDWYSKGMGIASNEGDPTDWERAEELRDMMEKWQYTGVDKIYDPSATVKAIVDGVNKGRGFINYIGHGDVTYWGTTGFSNNDIDNLKNGSKLPFIVSVACVNGHFADSQDAFGEHWLKAGSATKPQGAIAVYASSTNQAWVEPTVGQKAIVELLTQEKTNTIGSLFIHGSVALLEANMSASEQTFETWHIFGDATLQVRTQKPAVISAKITRQRDGTILVSVGEKDIAAGLTFQGELVSRGVSNKNGELTLQVPTKFAGNSAQLTLTGFNKKPLIQSVSL